MIILVFIQFFGMILVFILFSFFIVGEILQPSGGHVQGKGILIAGMAPVLSYDNTRSERLNFFGEWNENKISRQYILLKIVLVFVRFLCQKIVFISF